MPEFYVLISIVILVLEMLDHMTLIVSFGSL